MFGNGRTFPQQDDRWEDEVDAQMDNQRHPDDYAVSLCEVQLQDVGADAKLDQGHAVEVK